MNERDIELHVKALVEVVRAMDDATGAQKVSLEETAINSVTALATNFLINMERQATAMERIAECLEEKNK